MPFWREDVFDAFRDWGLGFDPIAKVGAVASLSGVISIAACGSLSASKVAACECFCCSSVLFLFYLVLRKRKVVPFFAAIIWTTAFSVGLCISVIGLLNLLNDKLLPCKILFIISIIMCSIAYTVVLFVEKRTRKAMILSLEAKKVEEGNSAT